MLQFYKAVQNMLTYAEIGHYVNCDPDVGGERTLLGLTTEDLSRRNPYKHVILSFLPDFDKFGRLC